MSPRDYETLKLVAGILGNIAAIAVGIALFEKDQGALLIAFAFACMAVLTIRSGV